MEYRDRRVAAALCEVAIPHGTRLGPVSDATMVELEHVLAQLGPPIDAAYPTMLRALDALAFSQAGAAFADLDLERRTRVLASIAQNVVGSFALNAVLTPLRITRTRELARRDGRERARGLEQHVERPRYLERAIDARSFEHDEHLEADVVIVGTGAGGAALAHALTVAGCAVLMLEEGGLPSRADFQTDVLTRQRLLYRPMTMAFGNTLIPIPTGVGVGGTTTINSGTCFRPPDEVMRRWRFELGLTGLSEDALAPYFERVEAMLGVCETTAALTSASERMVAKGAEALGLVHGPLFRNAPDCDGQSECCFGCPTDAKRSTNVSYVPAAMKNGAMLCYHARVERILCDHGKTQGVRALAIREDGKTVRLVVRAPAVALACGTFETPALLLRNGLANRSGELGKHLTIHPAAHAWARFDHALSGPRGVPQGHFVELTGEDGVRLEGGLPPEELAVTSLMRWGASFTELIEHYDELAFSGFMIRDDHARGRVTLDGSGIPRVTYWLSERDQHKLVKGHAALARIFLAAGARAVYPGLFHRELASLESEDEVRKLEAMGKRLHARDFALSAFHPLGTCRMGTNAATSVIAPNHETHDVKGLFVCDGSAVPGPLGVNPQITIMAFSERASEHVARHVDTTRGIHVRPLPVQQKGSDHRGRARQAFMLATRRADAAPIEHALTFAETMRGMCHEVAGARRARLVRMEVHAETCRDSLLRGLVHEGSTFTLGGSVHVETLCENSPCEGTLRIVPRDLARALVYELRFHDDAGAPCVLYGEKRVRGLSLISSMTTLHTEISSGEHKRPVLRGMLHFELEHFLPWLRSFRLG